MVPGATDNPLDGPARHVHEISKRLAKKGFIILNVIPCLSKQSSPRSAADSYALTEIPVTDLRLIESVLTRVDGHLGSIFHYCRLMEAMNKLLRTLDRPIILHMHGAYGFHVLTQSVNQSKLCKRLVTIHGFAQLDALAKGHSRLKATLLQSFLKTTYQKAIHYTTFSKTMMGLANRLYELDPGRVTIVPHGVDTNFFSPQANTAEIERIDSRLKLGKPHKVLFLGHMGKGKGLNILLEAFRILKHRRSDIMLIVKIGIENDRLAMLRLSERLGIRDLVRVISEKLSQADLRALYKASDVFVNYHLLSGHSTALLEAMASGIPSITYKQSINMDIVDQSCSIILETLKATELADGIETLVADKNLARTLGRNAMEKVQREFDWEKVIVPRYMSVYRNMED